VSEKLVVVDTFDYFPQASTAKAMLENRGIPVVMTDAEVTNTIWLWSAATGGIKIAVPESHAAVAREVMKEMRRIAKRPASVDENAPLEGTCPACGARLPETGTLCAKCGWSFEGEEIKDYENGPVPTSLLSFVYTPIYSHQFALPIAKVADYVDWCERNGVEVTGWEIWERGLPSHTTLRTGDGDAGELEAALAKFDREDLSKIYVCVKSRPQEPPHNED
jgi:hypothetical protein